MISIIIPSVNDPVLQKTVDDIWSKAETEIEVIVVFDGVSGKVNNARVFHKEATGLRDTVNYGVARAKGEYILKVDDHCQFGQGFDKILLEDIELDWIVIPRRYFLDVEKWEVMDDEPVDYDRLSIRPEKIGGVRWRQRAQKRKDILVDETMVFQGSCYFMSKNHWSWLGGLQTDGYGPFAQEPVELALKTWLGGGKVMVNKKTWYAHKHRKFGRIKSPCGKDIDKGNAYSRDFWLNDKWADRKHDFNWLMKRFGL